jgi:hypothetical protein
MALQLPGVLDFLGPLIEPILWLSSPLFRASTRRRWEHGGGRLRIGEVGLWMATWIVVAVVVPLVIAQFLPGTLFA